MQHRQPPRPSFITNLRWEGVLVLAVGCVQKHSCGVPEGSQVGVLQHAWVVPHVPTVDVPAWQYSAVQCDLMQYDVVRCGTQMWQKAEGWGDVQYSVHS